VDNIKEVYIKKLEKYCSYQDRCHFDVRMKLLSLKVYGDDLEEIMAHLVTENYLNEERYARSYARGKFRMKRWGKNKIKQNLQMKQISAYCIAKAMEEIVDEEYYKSLKEIMLKSIQKNHHLNELIKKDKAIKYAASRGYEAQLIFEVIKEFETNSDILS